MRVLGSQSAGEAEQSVVLQLSGLLVFTGSRRSAARATWEESVRGCSCPSVCRARRKVSRLSSAASAIRAFRLRALAALRAQPRRGGRRRGWR